MHLNSDEIPELAQIKDELANLAAISSRQKELMQDNLFLDEQLRVIADIQAFYERIKDGNDSQEWKKLKKMLNDFFDKYGRPEQQ